MAKFLEEGHKVKITIMFRGREVFHPELGKKILDRIAEQMDGMGKSESVPRLDGRNMVMVLAPDKRAKQSAASEGPGHTATGRHHGPAAVTGRADRRPSAQPGTRPERSSRRPPRGSEPTAATEPAQWRTSRSGRTSGSGRTRRDSRGSIPGLTSRAKERETHDAEDEN